MPASGLGSTSVEGQFGRAALVSSDGLTHLTYFIDGRMYSGEYRRLSGERVEVYLASRKRRAFLDGLEPETVARQLLEQMIGERPDEL